MVAYIKENNSSKLSYLQKRSEPPAMLRLITMLQHKTAWGSEEEWMLVAPCVLSRLVNSQ